MKAPPPTDSPVETPPAAPPAPSTPAPRVATWPQWVKSIDAAMAGLVLIAAFMVASNVARNSDQWLHYAGGRALLNGTYSFGTDPFSHVTEGRVWVNHSWLAGAAMYLLYNGDPTGFVLVAVKAFLFAATFGILFLIRRPGQSLWPWVFASAVALIAALPHSGLRPFLLSGLFLATTLYVLLGRDWKAGAKFNTIALGILFWIWASCDAWFVVGPAAVALVLLGEVVQKFLRSGESDDRVPTVRQLAVALAVGAVACSLTPHHVRVWQLPVELGVGLPQNYQSDYEIATVSLSPLNERLYLRLTGRGWNANGLAFAALLVGGGFALAVGFARLRAAHLFLWIGFAGLALLHFRLILFFTIVAVPVLSLAVAGLVDRVPLGPTDGPRAKLLILLSSVGRIIAFPFVLMLVAAAYPGWLHPGSGHPSMAPRCAWGVEPDPGLRRTAELLAGWRESGKLPADYRGLVINFDLANHIAWFAPKEKVFANGRFALHGPELEELIKARRIFLDRQPGEPIELVEIENFRDFCQKHDVTYVVYSGLTIPPAQRVDTAPLYQLSSAEGNYSLWHVDGRAIVLGDQKSKQFKLDAFRALAFDPIRLAFNPDLVQPLKVPPDGKLRLPVEPTFLDPFVLDLPKPPSLESLDAVVWNEIAIKHAEMDFFQKTRAWPPLAGAVGNPVPAGIAQESTYRADDLTTAYHFLAIRAAYRAIAENPDHPDPYLVIAQAGGSGRGPDGMGVPASIPGLRNELKQQLEVSGLRQYLDRIPSPEQANPMIAGPGYVAALWLQELYQPGTAAERGQAAIPEQAGIYLNLATRYFPRSEMALRNPKWAEERLKVYDAQSKKLDTLASRANDRYQQFKNLETYQQIRAAIEFRMYSQAQAKFQEAWNAPDTLGPDPLGLTLLMVRVYIQIGQLEEADYFLREVDLRLEKGPDDEKARPQWESYVRFALGLRSELWQLRGDFKDAGEAMEQSMQKLRMSDIERGFARIAASKPNLYDFDAFLNSPHLMATVGGFGTVGQGQIQFSLEKWQTYVEFFIHRGLMLLMEGKPSEARFRFEQALRPEQIDLPKYLPQRAIAEQYIRLIDRAAK